MSAVANSTKEADRKDIDELVYKIKAFQNGKLDEEKFRHYRLTRGVYGQRQAAVQMFRTKLPYGKVTSAQLRALADIADHYSIGNLHLTTRQNVQFHHVSLENAPAIWEKLSLAGLTAREACGNTVRNITASAEAGIDPKEPFDVTPYVQAMFTYFLRNPICQDMGRKIKIAFSSSHLDTAYVYFHDFGFIPKIENGRKGFILFLAGGLGAQSIQAHQITDFMPNSEILAFVAASLRVFDRYGEREKRYKARMKYLVKKLGLEAFLELVQSEIKQIKNHVPNIEDLLETHQVTINKPETDAPTIHHPSFLSWKKENTFHQKQTGFHAIQIKLRLGNLSTIQARGLSAIVDEYAADDIRFTVNQGILLRFLRPENLPAVHQKLLSLDLADIGFNSISDITACPGTDTCALGVTNSTALANVIEKHISLLHPNLVYRKDIDIKISGCMNSCGQHMIANIGLHGSSIKKGDLVIPAMQILLGPGHGYSGAKQVFADKVIKVPTKRIPEAISKILVDFQNSPFDHFAEYYVNNGKAYFFELLKPIKDLSDIHQKELIDWGEEKQYVQSIGVGECAGAQFDLVSGILSDASDKIAEAKDYLNQHNIIESMYSSYTGAIIGAKALLLSVDAKCNTHLGIIKDFDDLFIASEKLDSPKYETFAEFVLQVKTKEPTVALANEFLQDSKDLIESMISWRNQQVKSKEEELVISNYYKA